MEYWPSAPPDPPSEQHNIARTAVARFKLSIPSESQLNVCLGHFRAPLGRPYRGYYWLGILLGSQHQQLMARSCSQEVRPEICVLLQSTRLFNKLQATNQGLQGAIYKLQATPPPPHATIYKLQAITL